jgi:phosphoribosylformylglycinamidine (FGAM) synthase-like enzyme
MGDHNPIVSVHDQGAGGPANVLKELVEKAGGKIELRRIKLGDPTLSVLKIWIAEYQERCGFLIPHARIEEFQFICEREKVNCEILGESQEMVVSLCMMKKVIPTKNQFFPYMHFLLLSFLVPLTSDILKRSNFFIIFDGSLRCLY